MRWTMLLVGALLLSSCGDDDGSTDASDASTEADADRDGGAIEDATSADAAIDDASEPTDAPAPTDAEPPPDTADLECSNDDDCNDPELSFCVDNECHGCRLGQADDDCEDPLRPTCTEESEAVTGATGMRGYCTAHAEMREAGFCEMRFPNQPFADTGDDFATEGTPGTCRACIEADCCNDPPECTSGRYCDQRAPQQGGFEVSCGQPLESPTAGQCVRTLRASLGEPCLNDRQCGADTRCVHSCGVDDRSSFNCMSILDIDRELFCREPFIRHDEFSDLRSIGSEERHNYCGFDTTLTTAAAINAAGQTCTNDDDCPAGGICAPTVSSGPTTVCAWLCTSNFACLRPNFFPCGNDRNGGSGPEYCGGGNPI